MKAKILTCTIYFHSVHLGKPLEAIEMPNDCHFLGIVRAGRLVHAHENPILQDGDSLIAIAMNSSISPALRNFLQLKQKVA
jgi:Trk K+ transport system NAD-binding subunit